MRLSVKTPQTVKCGPEPRGDCDGDVGAGEIHGREAAPYCVPWAGQCVLRFADLI